ncbi:histidinol dehydrogenase [Methanocella arvoryzae]|uniref:Histidinol dehydrogenase n=1 Tax=Methanocella arvoryzae (strain DSM 22066 / NBRC 105507 / MRE50) TaxID=351160 RepID=Q0W7T6_METAR|nr:histidinol dehydrogenase [Methanocella arvoryzae]CAJ35557.1 histidinol dehydrogenase [Methanocella arvoryzae MRE50]
MIKKLSSLGSLEEVFKRRTSIESAMESAKRIVDDVKVNGDTAVRKYTKQFDGVDLDSFALTEAEIDSAFELIDYETLEHLQHALDNIETFHSLQMPQSDMWLTEVSPGIRLGQKYTALASAGAYVPGGTGSYPSSALMLIIPAKVAGVPEVVACTPPRKDGTIHPLTITAIAMAGADEIYRVGGVQAIAAMAFGTESVRKVDKIVGPGNAYVTAAKMYVRGAAEIDMPAGPSEIVVIADETGNPVLIASDMIAQMEHDVNSLAVLITPSEALAKAVDSEIKLQTSSALRKQIIEKAGYVIYVTDDLVAAAAACNEIAPEHVEIMVANPMPVLNGVRNAGTIYVGEYAPVAAGDYASGANHVLPTGGYAKTFSGMNVMQFLKTTSVQYIEKEGLENIRDIIVALANIEGFDAHAKSVMKRFS